jgi:hypothetical protein
MSNKRLRKISRKVKPKSRSYQSTFEQRHGMLRAVSGGNGLFLMTEQFVTNIGRAPRRVVPILRPVVQAMDHLGVQLPKAAASNQNIEPLHKICRLI